MAAGPDVGLALLCGETGRSSVQSVGWPGRRVSLLPRRAQPSLAGIGATREKGAFPL